MWTEDSEELQNFSIFQCSMISGVIRGASQLDRLLPINTIEKVFILRRESTTTATREKTSIGGAAVGGLLAKAEALRNIVAVRASY